MNLFRSEEHIRSWSRFDPAAEQGIVPLANLVMLFSLDMFKKRLEPDYIARSNQYVGEFLSAIAELAKTSPFWRM
jgi:hypothetical protein